jgi:hypothetical protein
MRILFILTTLLCLAASPVLAGHPGASLPPKPVTAVQPPPANDARVGGDTVASAVPIPELPFSDTGSTAGFNDDYDEICPYDAPGSPDVVYSLELVESVSLTVDLCGSSYDTKVYLYDEALQLITCNDDYYFDEDPCGLYVSKIAGAILAGGQTIYIVVDGYGGEFGDYVLEVTSGPPVPCGLPCPPDFLPEGEPPLVDDYVDEWNGGCNSEMYGTPFQVLNDPLPPETGLLCGVSGWYVTDGFDYRDTDWFEVYIDDDGEVVLTLDAQQPTLMLELFPQDCIAALVVQEEQAGPCAPATMTVTGPPTTWAWVWVGPASFEPPYGFEGNEFNYLLWTDDTPTAGPDPELPPVAHLLPVHPNPFNPRATVSFELPSAQHATVAVYDPTGRRLAVLLDEERGAGSHAIAWDGRDAAGRALPSGSYIVRLETARGTEARKVTLLR